MIGVDRKLLRRRIRLRPAAGSRSTCGRRQAISQSRDVGLVDLIERRVFGRRRYRRSSNAIVPKPRGCSANESHAAIAGRERQGPEHRRVGYTATAMTRPPAVRGLGAHSLPAGRRRAQIDTGIIEKHKAALEKQTTDPDQKREGGTQPRDWDYQLAGRRADAPGHVLRRRRHARSTESCFCRRGSPRPASCRRSSSVTASTRCRSASRSSRRGLPNAAWSRWRSTIKATDSAAADRTTSGCSSRTRRPIARAVTEKEARILLKRTNLNNVHEVADFRAAVSFLQGEPGVDPDKHRHLGIEQRRLGRRSRWRPSMRA